MVELVCALLISGPEVVLRYEAINHDRGAVFMANLVRDVRFKQYPTSAYVALSADGQRLNLVLATSPLPYDMEVEFGVPALYLKVLPQERVSGEIRLLAPVTEWDAYHLPGADIAADLVSVNQVALAISVIAQENAAKVEAVPAAPRHLRVSGRAQQAKCVVSAEAPILVRKRRDNLPRV